MATSNDVNSSDMPFVCHCIIPHPSEARLLLLRLPSGEWALPSVRISPNYWSPDWLGRLNRDVRQQVGLQVTVLRHVTMQLPDLVSEFENHSPAGDLPPRSCWVSRSDLAEISLASPGGQSLLDSWFTETESGEVPPARAPWERRGWRAEAEHWIDAQLARLGQQLADPVQQLKGAWPDSCVLRVPTTHGNLYFKADSARPPAEPDLTAALAAHWPGRVPEIVAADTTRRWMLTRDFGSQVLEVDTGMPLPPLPRWEGAMRTFAQLQIEASKHIETWLALGCDDRRAAGLARQLEELVSDDAALRTGQPGGLSNGETHDLRKLVPRIGELFTQLESEVGPASLVHQDFRGGNVALLGEDYLFFDWADTAVGHPFFSGVNFLHHSRYPIPAEAAGPSGLLHGRTYSGATLQAYLRDAYLEPWTIQASAARLRDAFALAQQLWYVWLAIQSHRELPYVERTAPAGIIVGDVIPGLLRDVVVAFGAKETVQTPGATG
jgi:hypothetical protein